VLKFMRNKVARVRDPDVTIGIPTWQAEEFIARTLQCARRQTHANVRIMVSVDQCEDATEEICKAHAREDPRVEIFVQKERLGWADNVNFLLDKMSTEFYFLYFHDDLIESTYTEHLLRALRRRPDAASVHCDMGHFGASDYISFGKTYDGSAAQRLITFFFTPNKGSPLRSMTRTDVLSSGLRFPTAAEGGFWANQPFLMKLLAVGPALRVPEVLYKRWDKRKGGLTDSWTGFTLDQVISGYRINTRICLDILEGIPATESERSLLTFGLYFYIMSQVRAAEKNFGVTSPIKPEVLSPVFDDLRVPHCLSEFEPEIQKWVLCSYEQLS